MAAPGPENAKSVKNQAKVDKAASALVAKLNDWLASKPTGQRRFTVEINASQGGIGVMFIEGFERGKV